LNYVIPIYDSMSQYVVPAIQEQSAANRVRIATFNGTPFVLKLLEDNDVCRWMRARTRHGSGGR
jgi:ribose transport system substrate-binding protein